MRVLKDFNKMNSQAEMQCHSIAQCLLNMEECNRMSGSGGCAAACCFLKPAMKRQTEGTGECFARLKQHMACRLCLANVAVCLACQMAGRRHAACMAGCLPPAGHSTGMAPPSQPACPHPAAAQNLGVTGSKRHREGRWVGTLQVDGENGRPEVGIETVLGRV